MVMPARRGSYGMGPVRIGRHSVSEVFVKIDSRTVGRTETSIQIPGRARQSRLVQAIASIGATYLLSG